MPKKPDRKKITESAKIAICNYFRISGNNCMQCDFYGTEDCVGRRKALNVGRIKEEIR